MNKSALRTICLVLCMMLCFGGIGAASGSKVAMGRYGEVLIDLPMNGYLSFTSKGGTIYCVDGRGEMMFKSTDLDHWDMFKTGHDEQIAPAQEGVNGVALGADGAIYLSSGWAMKDEQSRPYVERIKDGKAERVQLDQKLGGSTDRLQICVLPSGELMGLNDIEAYRFSAEGTTVQKYAVSGGESMSIYGDEVAILSPGNSLITVLDIKTAQMLRTLPLPSENPVAVIGYDLNGALYYASSEGLYQINAGGTIMLQIADGRFMSASKPDIEARAMLFDAENNPIIAYSNNGSVSLVAYHYDENVATEPGKLVSVFTLYDRPTLRELTNKFQLDHPDVMVDIVVALPQGTAITRDDAIRTLNTQVLAGKGPDVIVLDGLPAQNYIEKGVLMDLSPVVQPMIDSSELLGNIAGAFKAGDAIPAVSTRFMMPSLWGEVEGMNTLSDMAAWAQANPDSLPYYGMEVEPLIGTFYPSCAPAWFTEDKTLDEAKIEAFLTALKAIRGSWNYEAYKQRTGWDDREGATPDYTWWRWNPYQPRGQYYRRMGEEMGCHLMNGGFQRQLPYLMLGLQSAAIPGGAMPSAMKGSFAPLPGQAEGCFVPSLLLGASKGAANGEGALTFIEFALGEGFQNTDLMEGFQANAKALDRAQASGKINYDYAWGNDDWFSKWLEPDRQNQLRSMIDQLTTPVLLDFTLYEMIVQESTPFFEGEISAQQAASNVCAKANQYLSE